MSCGATVWPAVNTFTCHTSTINMYTPAKECIVTHYSSNTLCNRRRRFILIPPIYLPEATHSIGNRC